MKFEINLKFFEDMKEKNCHEAQHVVYRAWKSY